jgi:hypothetical protein
MLYRTLLRGHILGVMVTFGAPEVVLNFKGSYGILWASKNLLGFGDIRFHKRAPLMMNFLTGLALMNYWLPAYLIASSTTRPPLYVLGMGKCCYMFASERSNMS